MALLKISEYVRTIGATLKQRIVNIALEIKLSDKKLKRRDSLLSKTNIREKNLELPYSIKDGHLSNKFDIRYNPKKLNDWNLALKFLLIDCKHLIMLQNLIDGCEATDQAAN